MFGKRLNTTRKSRGYTARYMSEQLHIDIRTYRMYESSDRCPSLDMLVSIADLLNVSTDYLLCRDEWLN